ncbi:MAG: hypothetical protein NC337_06735 [Roseburia sp.]|nr:hypothetical protein [Roseburia sp.]
MEYVTLNNGVKMPVLGYGVYQISKQEENFNVFDFALNEKEMAEIQRLDEGKSLFASHLHDETGAWLRADPPREADQ